MLLAIDIGNTNIKFGIFENETLKDTLTVSTDRHKTADEYSVQLYALSQTYGFSQSDFVDCIISSVVPSVTARIASAIRRVIGIEPKIVGPGIRTGLDIRIEDPGALGADLCVLCVAAKALYPTPCIVISMGTATVMCVLDRSGAMLGGPIAPGVNISLDALASSAALLHAVSLDAPTSVIGKSTDHSIRAGVVWGNVCMIDGMIDRIEHELGNRCSVVATGGLAHDIIPHCTHAIDIRDDLIMQGLRLIYEKNR